MKQVIILGLFGIVGLSSCSEKEPICDCIAASEKFNDYSRKALTADSGHIDAKKFKNLKDDKTKKCAPFQKMSGSEMLERKKSCK